MMYPGPLIYAFGCGVTPYGLIMIGRFVPGLALSLRLAREWGLAPVQMLAGILLGILMGYAADRLSQGLNLTYHTGVLITPGLISVPAGLRWP